MAPTIRRRPQIDDAGWPVGDERMPLGVLTWTDVTPATAATAYAWPFFAPHPIIPAKLSIALTTGQAGAAARGGIYTNAAGRPAALVEDLGELDLSATTGKRQFTTATLPVVGVFWAIVWLKNVATQATVRGPGGVASNFVPVASTALVSSTGMTRSLILAAAYPGAMPAAAPAVAAHTGAFAPLCTVEAG
jgi:hypothetical protein